MRLLGKKGYTLLEMILVIVIVGILAVVIGMPLIQGSLAWQSVNSRKDAIQQARLGLDRMVREIRNVQRTAADQPNMTDVTSTCVNYIDLNGQQVVYRSNAGTIQRGSGGTCGAPTGATTLVSNVTGFTITCYNSSNAVVVCSAANAPNVRRLMLNMSVAIGAETVTLTSQVVFRSLLSL